MLLSDGFMFGRVQDQVSFLQLINRMKVSACFPVLFLAILQQCYSKSVFRFANIFGDHMVLQKGPQRATIWGFGEIGQDVIVVHMEEMYRSSVIKGADGEGIWSIVLVPQPHGGPYKIQAHSTVNGIDAVIELHDVLFGDVWFCSGQSNMQFTVSQSDYGKYALQNSVNYPNIRVFTAKEVYSNVTLTELKDVEQPWSIPSPETIGGLDWTYFSAVCWYYGVQLQEKLHYPIGLIASTWGGTLVEAWSSPDALRKCYSGTEPAPVYRSRITDTPQNDNSVLWNAMVHPFLNMSIYGAIWYQGEQNAVEVNAKRSYNCTFPAMIDDWRLKWSTSTGNNTKYDFPFGFVQLSAYGSDFSSQAEHFAALRWNQTTQYGYVPNQRQQRVFMAVSMDLGNPDSKYSSIHPTDKKDVGYRLALAGLAIAYNDQDLYYTGPLVADIEQYASGKLLITFNSHKDRIIVFSNNGFEVLCKGQWVAAPIIDYNFGSVLINPSTTQCYPAAAIRYAWSDYPCAKMKCAIYSDNLPSPPFIKFGPFVK